ncbi:MAG: DUF2764 family protein [Clostridia bacterium]|nr:DUF2764 family protein [Clostridia bacterium]
MAEYYLISQLPSLDGISESTPVPITEDRFIELCNRYLSVKSRERLKKLTLTPSKVLEASGSKLIDQWNEGERDLRLALGKARAEKMKKPFDIGNGILPVICVKAANAVMEINDPMEAEKLLNRFRLEMLEALRPLDTFSEDYIFYYGIKLKLVLRIRQFDKVSGEKAYKNIYNSVLSGDRVEAT